MAGMEFVGGGGWRKKRLGSAVAGRGEGRMRRGEGGHRSSDDDFRVSLCVCVGGGVRICRGERDRELLCV